MDVKPILFHDIDGVLFGDYHGQLCEQDGVDCGSLETTG
jgi:hypothetical protein